MKRRSFKLALPSLATLFKVVLGPVLPKTLKSALEDSSDISGGAGNQYTQEREEL